MCWLEGQRSDLCEEGTEMSSYGTRVYPKVSGLSRQRNNNNKHSSRSNTKGYGGITRLTHKIVI
jgi:hypothetical protein